MPPVSPIAGAASDVAAAVFTFGVELVGSLGELAVRVVQAFGG